MNRSNYAAHVARGQPWHHPPQQVPGRPRSRPAGAKMDFMAYLSERSKPTLLALALSLVALVGMVDYFTIPPFSFELFYIVPILLAAWFVGRSGGIFISFACAGAAFLADLLTTPYPDITPRIWNAAVQLSVFLIASQIATALEHLRRQQEANRIAILKRTDELKTALLHAVSHDLRTPLASIKTSVTSLLDSSVDWDAIDQRALLEGIDEESDRLNRLVGNLLDMSRLEGGMVQLERDWYSIDEVIHTTLRRLKPSFGSQVVEVNVPDDLPLIHVDFVRIDQVLTNLVENTIKYTPPGTLVEISARRGDGVLEVTVSDNGPGVAQQHLAHLFDRFYRVSGTGQPQSIGLGLSIAKGMVQAHGGQIYAKSWPGQGLSITFTLPLALSAPGEPDSYRVPPESETSKSQGHSARSGAPPAEIARYTLCISGSFPGDVRTPGKGGTRPSEGQMTYPGAISPGTSEILYGQGPYPYHRR
jgi:signal transduction histidine kinase